MKTRHSIQKKSDEKKARRAARKRGKGRREGEDEMDPFVLAGKDYSPSMLGDVERKKRARKTHAQHTKRKMR